MEPLLRLIPNAQRVRLNVTERAMLLGQNPWLAKMDWSNIELLAHYLDFFTLGRGKRVFSQGDDAVFMALIQEGKVEIRKEGHDGDEQTIAIIGPGQVIGEMSLIDGGSRSATALTAENAKLFILTEPDFESLRKNNPSLWGALLVRFIKTITKRLRRASGQFVDLLAEHGAIEDSQFETRFITQDKPKIKNTDSEFLWRQLNALNNQVAKVSEQITARIAASQDAAVSGNAISVDSETLARLSVAAERQKVPVQDYINGLLKKQVDENS
ncbi:MAG: cyclic nucleotide-binding domain-containing protein [Ketobacteraceae bacterium]|nr:cyclic nucleotide-binding domain-containing protein [Ketobacteraceae bacterium]